MSIAEVQRAVLSYTRRNKTQAKEKATYDYLLAYTIASNIMKSGKFPAIYEIYPTLFEEMNIKEDTEVVDKLSSLRLLEFARIHNKKFKEKEEQGKK